MPLGSSQTKGGMYTGSYTADQDTMTFDQGKYNRIKKRDANGYTTSNVDVTTKTDAFGNAYTSAVSAKQMDTSDFLLLMLQELKLQDPTKPMDSQNMMNTQMQMSTMQTNMTLAKSMEKLVASYSQSSLSNATSLIGRNVETYDVDDRGITKAYTVTSVETIDGEIVLKGRQILYMQDIIKDKDDKVLAYDENGYIYGEDGKKTGQKIVLKDKGQVALDKDGKPVILDENNEEVKDHTYEYTGQAARVYSDELTTIPMSNVGKIFS
ncbi:flagellar hook assembly protein [Malaciobacter molluscorum LMG 25693]|uniref:Basal-body rod modification protein FlgD n=2 Tax=Malaciobacter molluscorum LMG 25693 TaxID=870501 RepID=A0AB33GPU5_9BACT|nr:flagellar hook capping FlgD N-terminal domain-containing protein [Malaciobacter molluscorum]AXX93145.1 flagellar hook assembly protein [Malaciobacter molluscorum LMG 25693]